MRKGKRLLGLTEPGKELLVIVTSFFRDKYAFIELEKTVEELLLKKEKNKIERFRNC